MGVLGLVPFLLKHSPNVAKELRQRFLPLSGQTVAIDGTLITQRFHYAPFPHQYKHVLGWYRLAQELQNHNIKAICVFDGKERNFAKAREVARRKEVQRVTSARGVVERERLARLRKLGVFFSRLDSMEISQKENLAQLVSERVDWDLHSEMTSPDHLGSIQNDDWSPDASSDYVTHEEILSVPDTTAHVSSRAADFGLPQHDLSYADYALPDVDEGTRTPLEDIVSELTMLYQQYRNSTSSLVNLPLKDASIPEISFSKSQNQLARDEGHFWKSFLTSSKAKLDSVALDTLTERSQVLSLSYERRTNAPTSQTYAECQAIITAMGIRCIETTGPFEAEALASSLVINGAADFVASEDTDVLAYEAPLLRNVTNRSGPLQMISGVEVRGALQLSRAAYIDFLILLGTDFSDRIKNVGPARALKFIRQYDNIEAIVQQEIKYPPRSSADAYLQQVATARKVFSTLPPVPDIVFRNMEEVDEALVRRILQRYGLGREVDVDHWDYNAALAGNFFGDNPALI